VDFDSTAIVVTDNNFQGMDFRFQNVAATPTWTGNGASTYDIV
jgi:hypothetical protein